MQRRELSGSLVQMTERGLMYCRYCAHEIANNAKLCSACSSYQAPWRNELKYWSGITGLVTLIVSGLVVSYTFGAIIYNRIFREDIWVSEFQLFGNSAFWNQSEADIMISTVRITTTGPTYDLLWHVDQMVETSAGIEDGIGRKTLVPLRLNLSKTTNTEWHGTVADQFNYNRLGNYTVGVSDTDIRLLKGDDEGAKGRFTLDFVLMEGAQHSQLQGALGSKLFQVPADCEVSYLKFGSRYFMRFPCVGLLRHRNVPARP
ncbi:hypothetical protein [Rhizobium laguerreae]|uniref:hypothetical protein n=1 Tax=Rhizobium laguerreae TaxID=1076926 RepID=UPI001C91E19E|nr:hypothetical protein [Rhizobium laguerreae]MBY3381676.1 hypothetical protein [Rhizobium laguerreae]